MRRVPILVVLVLAALAVAPGLTWAQGVPRAEFFFGYAHARGSLPDKAFEYGSSITNEYESSSFSGGGLGLDVAINFSEHFALVGSAAAGTTRYDWFQRFYSNGVARARTVVFSDDVEWFAVTAGVRVSRRASRIHFHLDAKIGGVEGPSADEFVLFGFPNAFGFVGGAGVDVDLNRRFALRVADVSFVRAQGQTFMTIQSGLVFKLANKLAKAPGIQGK